MGITDGGNFKGACLKDKIGGCEMKLGFIFEAVGCTSYLFGRRIQWKTLREFGENVLLSCLTQAAVIFISLYQPPLSFAGSDDNRKPPRPSSL